MERHLWVVRAGLDAQIAAGELRHQRVAAEAGSGCSSAGRRPSSPKRPASNTPGPSPIVIVNAEAGRSSASPVSVGGRLGPPPVAPVAPTSRPRIMSPAATLQSFSNETRSSRVAVDERSNAAK